MNVLLQGLKELYVSRDEYAILEKASNINVKNRNKKTVDDAVKRYNRYLVEIGDWKGYEKTKYNIQKFLKEKNDLTLHIQLETISILDKTLLNTVNKENNY